MGFYKWQSRYSKKRKPDTKIRHTDTNRTTVTTEDLRQKTRVTTTVAQNTHEWLK